MSDFVLYRVFNPYSVLLYVGQTMQPAVRFRKHAEKTKYWGEVGSIELERFKSLDALTTAEKEAIRTERPVYNVQHNPGRPEAVEDYRYHIALLEEIFGEEELYGWADADDDSDGEWVLEEYELAPERTPEEAAEGRRAAELMAAYLNREEAL